MVEVECATGPFIPDVVLFHDWDECTEWCVGEHSFKPDFIDATGNMFMVDGIAVVVVDFEGVDDVYSEYGLLTHEAYHVVCQNLEEIGEEDAGEEITAYMIQCVAQGLFKAHDLWKEGRHAKLGAETRQDRVQ